MGTAVLLPQDYFASHNDRRSLLMGHAIQPPAVLPSKMQTLQDFAENARPLTALGSATKSKFGGSSSRMASVDAAALCRSYGQNMPSDRASAPLVHLISRSSPSPTFVRADPISQTTPTLSESSSATQYTRSQFLSYRSFSAHPTMHNSHNWGNKVSDLERPYSSTGRHPSILVGRNGVANWSTSAKGGFDEAALPENIRVSKFTNPSSLPRSSGFDDLPRKNVAFRKAMNACDVVGDLRKRTQSDFIPRKGLVEGDSARLPWKEGDVRKVGKRRSDKLATGQNGHDAESQLNTALASPPVVTILQRPKTREAAQEVLAKLKWKTEYTSSVDSVVWEGDVGFPSLKRIESLLRSHSDVGTFAESLLLQSNTRLDDGATDSIKSENPQGHETRATRAAKTEIASSAPSNFTEGTLLLKNGKVNHGTLSSVQNKALYRDSCGSKTPYCKGESGVEEDCTGTFVPSLPPATDERWAGPGYTNSPPPSSLPLPTFSLKQLRLPSTELPASRELMGNSQSLDRVGLLSFQDVGCEPGLSTCKGEIDMAFATKDLRRLLKLDSLT